MYKIKILAVGKTREAWVEAALEEYSKRLQSSAQLEFLFAKENAQLLNLVERESLVIGLDIGGKMMDSETFSSFLLEKLEQGGSRISFVIGGPEGLPQSFKARYPLVSLSLMTFTHQIVRVILVEQIYRGLEIAKKSPYHK